MFDKTKIDSESYTISSDRDDEVERMMLSRNKKISYLPENIDEKFPNIIEFSAASCNLKKISRKNFRNLRKLKQLWLVDNLIAKRCSDTFLDLESVEFIYLSEFDLMKVFIDYILIFYY